MFDTIVYIPVILAYFFISLLASILIFIIIYLSHRIYTIISDINFEPQKTDMIRKTKIHPALAVEISCGNCYLIEQKLITDNGIELVRYCENCLDLIITDQKNQRKCNQIIKNE